MLCCWFNRTIQCSDIFLRVDANYTTLEELQQALLRGHVEGILVDTYVADYRKDLFGHSSFMIQQVFDLKSTYGVVMGTDASKLRKCFNKYWKNNAAYRSDFIEKNTNPLLVSTSILFQVNFIFIALYFALISL